MNTGPAGKVAPDLANATLRSLGAGSNGSGSRVAVAVASIIPGIVPVGVDGSNNLDGLVLSVGAKKKVKSRWQSVLRD